MTFIKKEKKNQFRHNFGTYWLFLHHYLHYEQFSPSRKNEKSKRKIVGAKWFDDATNLLLFYLRATKKIVNWILKLESSSRWSWKWILVTEIHPMLSVPHMYLFLTYSLYINMSSLHSALTWPWPIITWLSNTWRLSLSTCGGETA